MSARYKQAEPGPYFLMREKNVKVNKEWDISKFDYTYTGSSPFNA